MTQEIQEYTAWLAREYARGRITEERVRIGFTVLLELDRIRQAAEEGRKIE